MEHLWKMDEHMTLVILLATLFHTFGFSTTLLKTKKLLE